jgi:CBS-domain-containing membrane protein
MKQLASEFPRRYKAAVIGAVTSSFAMSYVFGFPFTLRLMIGLMAATGLGILIGAVLMKQLFSLPVRVAIYSCAALLAFWLISFVP